MLRTSEPKGVSLALRGSTLPLTVRGSDASTAFRITVTAHSKPVAPELTGMHRTNELSAVVYLDQFGFVYGQVGVSWFVETLKVTPRLSLEQHLAKLLLTRARNAAG
jgi:hypothetical protein